MAMAGVSGSAPDECGPTPLVRAIASFACLLGFLGLCSGCTAGPIDVGTAMPSKLLTGVIAHWPLDEGAGSVVNDRSGHGHNGSLTGGTWIPGRFGGAVQFEGTLHDAITVPSFPQGTLDWSVALWVRAPVGDFPLPYLTLISTENLTNNLVDGGWEMNARLTAAEAFYQFAYWVGPGPSAYVSNDCHCVDLDRWTHIAGVVDSNTGTVSFYRDGVSQGQINTTQPIKPGSTTLFMGRWQSTERWLTGALDDIVIYDKALSASEVMELSLAPAPDTP
jgi:hypothetical protein